MSSLQAVALIPAAGASLRMGTSTPKILSKIADLTVLERTVASLTAVKEVSRLVIMTREDLRPEVLRLLNQQHKVPIDVIPGGEDRQASVKKGMQKLESLGICEAGSLILIHDAARCFVSPALVSKSLSAAREFGAVTVAIRVVDSLKRVSEKMQVEDSLDREGIWAVQTPQVFRYDLLKEAHSQPVDGALDDASLVEAIHPVHIVEGEKINFKITTREDLELARQLCLGNDS